MALGADRKDLIMVGVLLTGALLVVLNLTLLAPALPTIMAQLHVDAPTVQWLTSAYSLVEAVVIPLSAFLIGRFTTRQLFLTGFCVFFVGTLCAAFAPVFPVLLLGRVLQAASTGVIMPMVFTVILLVFPRERRGTAMGVISLIIGFAPAIGPSLSGVLVDTVGWRWLFGIVAILAVFVLIFANFTLRNYGEFKRTTFDGPSVALSTIGLVCLLYGLSTFASVHNIVMTATLMVIGIVVLVFYVRRQLTIPNPMLKVGILKNRKYATVVVIVVIVQAAFMGTEVITPLYVQGVQGYSATVSGFVMMPGAVVGAVMGLLSGRLFDRFGVRKTALPGVFFSLLGVGCLVGLSMESPIWFVTVAYTLLAIALQFTMTPLNTWGVNSLDNSVIQHAQGLSNTLNQVAISVGTALLVSISALAPVVAPALPPIQQSALGIHMAYCATAILMIFAGLLVVVFVKDKKKAGSGAQAKDTNIQPDYVAGLDGVTVDAVPEDDQTGLVIPKGGVGITVQDAMNLHPVVATSDMAMRDVVALMSRTDSSGLPVINAEGDLVGFISDGDVVNYLGRNDIAVVDAALNLYRFVDDSPLGSRLLSLLDLNVMEIATKKVVSVQEDTPIDAACRVLAERRIKKVPVVNGDRFVGTLSRRDLVRQIADILDKSAKR